MTWTKGDLACAKDEASTWLNFGLRAPEKGEVFMVLMVVHDPQDEVGLVLEGLPTGGGKAAWHAQGFRKVVSDGHKNEAQIDVPLLDKMFSKQSECA